MKKIVLCAAMSLICFAAYAPAGDSMQIGYSCSNFDDSFQMYVLDAAKMAAVSAGAKLTAKDAEEDVQKQIRHIETLLADRVSALIVVPVDTDQVDEIVTMASKAEVPLIFVNRNPYPGQRPPDNCFVVCSDAFVEGEAQMRFAGQAIGSLGHIVIIQGILANEATVSRTNGVKEIISSTYPELAITAEASANWRRDEARTLMRAWLKEFGREKIDAVLSNNDNMALGALDALEEAGIHDVTILGIDAIPEALKAIKDGRMAGTILQNPENQGIRAVEAALKAVRGEKQAQNVILPSELITIENVDQFLK